MKARFLSFLAGALALSGLAADWPQFRGPNRDDISTETGLMKQWPKDGPKLVWAYSEAGIGYAGPAIVKGVIYTMGAWDEKEHVYALDAKSSKRLWSAEIGKQFNNNYGDGPRGTASVDGSMLYVMGGQGNLVAVETQTGKVAWSKNMQKDFKGKMMSGWGYTESPLVDGDLVICSPGGSDGTLAALNKKTGELVLAQQGLEGRGVLFLGHHRHQPRRQAVHPDDRRRRGRRCRRRTAACCGSIRGSIKTASHPDADLRTTTRSTSRPATASVAAW